MHADFDPAKGRGNRIFGLCVLLATLAGMVCLLLNPYVWFDEAGQFFISLGVSHWAPPFSDWRTFRDILAENNRYLFDPVGFTLLLRLWAEISTETVWLRLLPFLGFLGMLGTAFHLLRRMKVPRAAAFLLICLFASSPLLYQYAAELRPYSFEAWGALFALVVLYDYMPQRSLWWKLRTGLIMAFFLWMRYPFALVAGLTAFTLGVKILIQKKDELWKGFGVYLLPQVLSAILIYVFCIRLQPLSHNVPVYAQAATLRYGGGFLRHPWTLFYHLALLGFYFVYPFREGFRYPKRFSRFALFAFLLFFGWNILSIFGLIPSDPDTRWAIALNAIAMMALVLALAAGLSKVPPRFKWLAYALLTVLALYRPALMTWRWKAGDAAHFRGDVFVRELSRVANSVQEPVWCSYFATPEVKYLYEYGALRSQQEAARYPSHFVLLPKKGEFDSLQKLPLLQKVLWIDSPGRYTRTGRFACERWNGSPVFFRLWRVK